VVERAEVRALSGLPFLDSGSAIVEATTDIWSLDGPGAREVRRGWELERRTITRERAELASPPVVVVPAPLDLEGWIADRARDRKSLAASKLSCRCYFTGLSGAPGTGGKYWPTGPTS
jgi:hypothetical protein